MKRIFKIVANECGASLVFVLLTSFLLISLATIVIQFSNTDLRHALKQDHQVSAYYIAEAGLERGIYEINKSIQDNTLFDYDYVDSDFQGGSYHVTIEPKYNLKGEQIGYTLTSKGTYQGEEKVVTTWVREPIWPEHGNQPNPLQYAIYANEDISIQTLSGLLGTGLLDIHKITVDGNVHANAHVKLKHNSITEFLFSPPTPIIAGDVSSTNKGYIEVAGLGAGHQLQTDEVPMPQFDFDYAREQAKEEGLYIPHGILGASLLGLTPTQKVIFIDGDLTILGVDLLGISLQGRTLVVNGTIRGLLLGFGTGEILSTPLNLIAKENINFLGAVTGLQVNGILYAQGNITSAGHVEVDGYLGAKNIHLGSGLLSNLSLLALLTGNMSLTYNPDVFDTLPSNIGFKQSYVEVVEQKERTL